MDKEKIEWTAKEIEAWLNLDGPELVESTVGRIGVLENSKLNSPGESL